MELKFTINHQIYLELDVLRRKSQLFGVWLILPDPQWPPPITLQKMIRQIDLDWTDEDWQALFDERAAIAEFDGGLLRLDAEALARKHCIEICDSWFIFTRHH